MPHASTGVEIRELSSPADLAALTRVFDDVWRPDPSDRPVSTDMLRALAHAGNYVAGAYVGDRLAGGSVGFFAAPAGETLHSHITGVARAGRGHNVGHALKLHQREWAAERGLARITWTFDPLVARNAYFNIAKLGAAPSEYLRDFYGDIHDEINAGDESDRLLLTWALDATPPGETAETAHDLLEAGAHLAIDGPDDDPKAVDGGDAAMLVVPVPRDIEAMRRSNPVAASRWRRALREALTPAFADGPPTHTRFLRSGHYVITTAASAG
ncbi:GNAT family N-acetyltransferase [Gordonia sp. CPCC 205515]|uniref:GNAT family N-acetyltransferase n=1 Tax=Gordonia sp. CPCC 205515 TaxID=3140791 RepID=UPI003AF3485C